MDSHTHQPIQTGSYYFIGIGGMGMAPLAMYLRGYGAAVMGSDDAIAEHVALLLERYGVQLGSAGIPEGVTEVIYSSAIKQAHPLYQQARARGLRLTLRGEFLARLAEGKKLIAVVGSHGKSTTSAMLAHMLVHAEADMGFVLGALPREGICPPALCSDSEWLVAEVDESDGTISNFSPEITVALNLDWDHPGYYDSEAKLDSTFRRLFEKTRQALVIPEGNARLENLVNGLSAEVLRFGPQGDFVGHITKTAAHSSTLNLAGRYTLKTLQVPAAGAFNASNALAALAAATLSGIKMREDPLADFAGVMRRQDFLYQSEQLVALSDYAHHPEELDSLIASLRQDYPGYQLIGLFQPHRYTRTRQYAKDFAQALERLDFGYVLPVYAASELPLADGTSAEIIAQIKSSTIETWPESGSAWSSIEARLNEKPSVLIFIGAGDIDKMARDWRVQLFERILASENGFDLKTLKPFLSESTYLSEAEPLGPKTTLRVGGVARWYAQPASHADLRALWLYAHTRGVAVFILGRGSNVLVADEGFDGLVIRLSHPAWCQITRIDSDRIWVGAGVRLKEICGHAALWGLSGFEFMEGIPGAVGGAVRMNAGAMGGWFMDVVDRVEWLSAEGELRVSSPSELDVIYRSTRGLKGGVALGAVLKATSKNNIPAEIYERTTVLSQKRKSTQPRESSAGCMFKNPIDNSAGKLIDELGLKGLQIGKAQISPIHGNFIVNLGNASADDVLALVKQVHSRVEAQTGIALEPEVQLLGKSWKEVF